MSETVVPVEARSDAILWPLPADHPSQAKLDPQDREETVVEALGATREDNGSWRLPATQRGSSAAKRAERKLGTRAAERRFQQAAAVAEGDWRMDVARAANAEVRSRGETPPREIPAKTPEPDERVYFYTAREKESPYHYRKLDAMAKDLGVALLVDRKPGSPNRGLRYMVGPPPADLEFFRSEAAKAAQAESAARKEAQDAELVNAASTMAPSGRQSLYPLTVPDPDEDAEGFKKAYEAIWSIGSAKLGNLLEVTRQARDELRLKKDTLIVKDQDLSPEEERKRRQYDRGVLLGQRVLDERQKAVETRAAVNRAADRLDAERVNADAPAGAEHMPERRAQARRKGQDLEQ